MSQNNINKPIPVSLSWSGGKDSAFALWKLRKDPRYEVVNLHTTFGSETRRVGLHGISEDLIQIQADSLNLPLVKVYYPASGDNAAYEKALIKFFKEMSLAKVSHVAYGDIFLEDLKQYRVRLLAEEQMEGVFPLWGMDTAKLVEEFLEADFNTLICAASADAIAPEWMGRSLDRTFLAALSPGTDPCGENGEFHTFCTAGPVFTYPIAVTVGDLVEKSYRFYLEDGKEVEKKFWFKEIKPLSIT